MATPSLRVTIVVDEPGSEQDRLTDDLLWVVGPGLEARKVFQGELVGRDVREAHRVLVWDWRQFTALPHVQVLLQRSRDKVLVVVADLDRSDPKDAQSRLTLLRLAGRVLTFEPIHSTELQRILLAPVHLVSRADLRSIAAALQLPAGAADEPETHLAEAQEWLRRGDFVGAFGSAARALRLAPDQPGVVADTARILVLLGERDKAGELCRSFLLQRPDAEPVRAVAAELATAGTARQ